MGRDYYVVCWVRVGRLVTILELIKQLAGAQCSLDTEVQYYHDGYAYDFASIEVSRISSDGEVQYDDTEYAADELQEVLVLA